MQTPLENPKLQVVTTYGHGQNQDYNFWPALLTYQNFIKKGVLFLVQKELDH